MGTVPNSIELGNLLKPVIGFSVSGIINEPMGFSQRCRAKKLIVYFKDITIGIAGGTQDTGSYIID